MKRHFATALSRLLNAFQAGGIGSLSTGVMLAKMLLASQAHSVSEVNGLAMKRHFATALSRLLNAFQAGGIGSFSTGVMLAKMLLASQAHSVSEVNGLANIYDEVSQYYRQFWFMTKL
jgi:purine-nucleoside phosphorylase